MIGEATLVSLNLRVSNQVTYLFKVTLCRNHHLTLSNHYTFFVNRPLSSKTFLGSSSDVMILTMQCHVSDT